MAYDAEWIDQLDITTPSGSESRTLGDNAIREIKKVLKDTFPAAVASDPLTVPFSTLNLLATQGFPRDSLLLWAGDTVALPNGPDPEVWTICDGRARFTGGFAPNLVNKFILGAKVPGTASPPAISFAIGQIGGSTEINITQFGTSTSVPFGTDSTTLTAAQIPGHRHFVANHVEANSPSILLSPTNSVTYKDITRVSAGDANYDLRSSDGGGEATHGLTSSTGSGQGHAHFFSIRTNPAVTTWANVPPFFAAVWLIKE